MVYNDCAYAMMNQRQIHIYMDSVNSVPVKRASQYIYVSVRTQTHYIQNCAFVLLHTTQKKKEKKTHKNMKRRRRECFAWSNGKVLICVCIAKMRWPTNNRETEKKTLFKLNTGIWDSDSWMIVAFISFFVMSYSKCVKYRVSTDKFQ